MEHLHTPTCGGSGGGGPGVTAATSGLLLATFLACVVEAVGLVRTDLGDHVVAAVAVVGAALVVVAFSVSPVLDLREKR